MDYYFTVSTNGHGLTLRHVHLNDTTVYADRHVATFDTLQEAEIFCLDHDHEYYDDPYED